MPSVNIDITNVGCTTYSMYSAVFMLIKTPMISSHNMTRTIVTLVISVQFCLFGFLFDHK